MTLTWMTTASLLLSDGDTVVAFDPFLPTAKRESDKEQERLQSYRDAAAVFVTHGHFDHILSLPSIYADRAVPVYATKTPCQTLKDAGYPPECLRVISSGDTQSIGRFTITAYQSRHCRFDLPLIVKTVFSRRFFSALPQAAALQNLRHRYPENGETLFYEVQNGDKRVQIMGSMNLSSDISYPTKADCLVLPLQGRSDQDNYALQFVDRLQPKRILIDHHDDSFPPLSDNVDTSGFIRNVTHRFSVPCEELQYGQVMEL